MIIKLEHKGKNYKTDLSKPLDISIPIFPNVEGVNCFYAPQCTSEPVRVENFVGSIKEGGFLNFKNIFINPHGNGTHTECVEHISSQGTSINKALKKYHFIGQVISVELEQIGADKIITKQKIQEKFNTDFGPRALIIRTLPNGADKLTRNYSGSNPPYCDPEAIKWIKSQGVEHLLLDLPSVDKEQDEGKLLSHKAFWNVPDQPELEHTITELIFVDKNILDGKYLVNIQLCSIELDAVPSKVVIYSLEGI